MSKKVAILGSTGSIGCNTLEVIEALHPAYEVIALSANNSTELLVQQTSHFTPQYVAITENIDAVSNQLRALEAYSETDLGAIAANMVALSQNVAAANEQVDGIAGIALLF